jgi:thiol-disulfide isomerase/thioredoxin
MARVVLLISTISPTVRVISIVMQCVGPHRSTESEVNKMSAQLTTKRYVARGKHVAMEGYAKGKSFVPHGDVTMAYSSGKLELTGSFVVGKAAGKWLRWYENGNLQSEHHYVSGLLHGPHKQYWEDGVLAREGAFVRGALDGDLNINDRKGSPERQFVYRKQRVVSAKRKIKGEWFDRPWEINATWICSLNQQEQLKCVTPYEFWQHLNTLMSPEDVERMMRILDELYTLLGLDKDATALTACGGTFVATRVQEGAQPGDRGLASASALMTSKQTDVVIGACRAAVTAKLQPKGISPSAKNDRGTRDAVNQMNDQVRNCHDSGNSMIAFTFGDVVDAITAFGEATVELGQEVVKATGDFVGSTIDRIRSDRDSKKTDQEKKEATDPHPGTHYDPPSTNPENGITTIRVTIAGRTTLRFYNPDGSEAAPERLETPEDRGEPSGWPEIPPLWPAAHIPVDETGKSKCERLAEWWETTKDFCEKENWTPYKCQEILRIFTGCADPALVMPTPDGSGVVCPQHSGMTEAEFRRLECKKKSMIMEQNGGIAAGFDMVPSGFGSEMCIERPKLSRPEMDICSNPKAMCSPIETLVNEEGIGGYWGGEQPQAMARVRRVELSRGTTPRNIRSYTEPSSLNEERVGGFAQQGRARASIAEHSNAYVPKSLSTYTKLNALNDEGFDASLKATNNKLNFVVFASKTCEPCHKVLDVFDEAAASGTHALFHYVDVSQNPELYRRFGIRFTPTIVVIKDGAAIGQRRVGAASREVLFEYVNRSIELGKGDQKVAKTNS